MTGLIATDVAAALELVEELGRNRTADSAVAFVTCESSEHEVAWDGRVCE